MKIEHEADVRTRMESVLWTFFNQIACDRFYSDFQKHIHAVKDFNLSIRAAGTEIKRFGNIGSCTKEFIKYYKSIVETCEDYSLKEIFILTDGIKMKLCKYEGINDKGKTK
ncbi:MAG: hypothetical protein HDR01_00820 [Lachnospiraceae bacterium]|nr:hypothetical protein [Lachnospiraceae bacterium]